MTAAIIVAAGSGKRMNSSVPKQYLPIYGKPVIYYTLKAFEESEVETVVLVTAWEEMAYMQELVTQYDFKKVKKIVAGGAQRYDSVYQGLLALSDLNCEYVLIHDGARPMITPLLIHENITCVKACGACVTAVPSKDTVKLADAEGYVTDTPDRSCVWQIQTPQSFSYETVREAYRKREEAGDETVTDDAMVVEKYAHVRVRLLMGDYRNIKITTPEDLLLTQAFVAAKKDYNDI